jgi:hypothetical protein
MKPLTQNAKVIAGTNDVKKSSVIHQFINQYVRVDKVSKVDQPFTCNFADGK